MKAPVYKIKQIPEDFFVEEILSKQPTGQGNYIWLTLEKTNKNLFDVIESISKQLGITRDSVGYAGLKDKNAITRQTISVYNVSTEKLKKVKIDGVKLSNFKKSSSPISLGDLKENRFIIVVRCLGKNTESKIKYSVNKITKTGALNLYDDQRFGINKNTHLIGKFIIKKDFKKAVELFAKDGSKLSSTVLSYLDKNPEDYIGSIKTLPKTLQMLFVNAYQSYLFNEISKACKNTKNTKIPLLGYDTILENYPDFVKPIEKILKKENIRLENFRTNNLPIKATGDERDLLVFPKDLKYKIEKDELNKNKLKATFEFSLPKGSYATLVVKEIFSK